MVRAKASGQAEMGPLVYSVAATVPGWLLRRVAPVLLRNQPLVNLAVSDLPGSPEPLHLLGARMLDLAPFITCTGNLALMSALEIGRLAGLVRGGPGWSPPGR